MTGHSVQVGVALDVLVAYSDLLIRARAKPEPQVAVDGKG